MKKLVKGKVVYVNTNTHLAAVDIGDEKMIVMEFDGQTQIKAGDRIGNICEGYGAATCTLGKGQKAVDVRVLSSGMSPAKAKMVVAPWQQSHSAQSDLYSEVAGLVA